MLEDVIAKGTGYPNAIIGRPAAGKTGTTSDFRDAWFVGYTPDLVTAVWLGNDDYSRMNESYGGNVPARIWARFMKAALAGAPKHDFAFPADEVAKLSGCGRGHRILSERNRTGFAMRRNLRRLRRPKPGAVRDAGAVRYAAAVCDGTSGRARVSGGASALAPAIRRPILDCATTRNAALCASETAMMDEPTRRLV